MDQNAPYLKRRERFYQKLQSDQVAVVGGAKETIRNGNVNYLFRQSSDLLYLTGFPEPNAVAVFTPGKEKRFSLFIKPRNLREEIYTGPKAGLEEAISLYGADQAFPMTELPKQLFQLLHGYNEVVTSIGENEQLESLLLTTISDLRKAERSGAQAPYRILDTRKVLHEQRLYKDENDLSYLQKAIEITAKAHIQVMKMIQPQQSEQEISAFLNFMFESSGGIPGYENIVAQGNQATILHYHQGKQVLEGGNLLLVDAGCEWNGFTADVTRTYPIPLFKNQPARFNPAQKRIYSWVLQAQEAGIQAARPGTTLDEIYEACSRVLTQGLVDVGILQGSIDDLMSQKKHRDYSLHGTSHFLGMDVHDVGEYFPNGKPRILEDGMVFTIEPGLYIPAHANVAQEYKGIGIRIEDDILITSAKPEGHEVLTKFIPKDPNLLEEIVGSDPAFFSRQISPFVR